MFDLPQNVLAPGEYLMKIVATDGVNTAESAPVAFTVPNHVGTSVGRHSTRAQS